jgi:hypothetical protein
MITYRDRLAREWRLTMIVGQNQEALGRAQDKDDGGGLETLRRDGYM